MNDEECLVGKQTFINLEHNLRQSGILCCSQLSYIWDFSCDHSYLLWLPSQHLLSPYWMVNISDQQLKSRCVCVMNSMHSTWNDGCLKKELKMHSSMQQWPEMYSVHNRAFVVDSRYLGISFPLSKSPLANETPSTMHWLDKTKWLQQRACVTVISSPTNCNLLIYISNFLYTKSSFGGLRSILYMLMNYTPSIDELSQKPISILQIILKEK